jgi:hypothetical protein
LRSLNCQAIDRLVRVGIIAVIELAVATRRIVIALF